MDGEMTTDPHLGVAIVGAVQTKYEAAKKHLAYNELVYEVVRELLDQTGIKMADIHSQITASQDMYDGKTISGMSVNEVVGGYLKSECKVAADGLQALLYGVARVASGSFEYTLVVAHCKESEGKSHPITGSMFDPFVERPLGLDASLATAMQAERYLALTKLSDDDLAAISQRRHRQATKNPFAQRSGEYRLDQIKESPVLMGSIRELLAGPTSDGACALLLANPAQAKRFGKKAVWVAGLGNSTDAYWTDRDLSQADALKDAASRACRAGGITGPGTEIDVAEISARYAYEEPLYAEALALCETEHVREWIASPDGSGPLVNPSGGAITGNPATVMGLTRAIEIYLQLSEQAGEHQVEGASVGLAHGRDGICGQNHSVAIMRSNAAVT
jgi:acetyl-CoA C-acetyltransferase